jgi:hypothetical protein
MFAGVLYVFEKVTKSRVLRFENEVSFNEIKGCYVVTFPKCGGFPRGVTNPILEKESTEIRLRADATPWRGAPNTTRGPASLGSYAATRGACAPRVGPGLFPGACPFRKVAVVSVHVIILHAGGTIGREVARGKDEFIRLSITRVITCY